jgi:peptidoglycan/LPS O-acetylase OafA/YrhL
LASTQADKYYEEQQMSIDQNRGSFDLIRLLAALAVLWSHHFVFTAATEIAVLPIPPAELGVTAFFAISGYLNAHSILAKPAWLPFAARRERRIFPALFAFAIFCVALGAVLTTSPDAFWSKAADFTWRNTALLFGLRYELPGVFEANHFARAINGSLWTLPIEVKLYIYLAILTVILRYKPRMMLIAYGLAGAVFLYLDASSSEPGQFNRLAMVFLSGVTFAICERLYGLKVAFVSLAAICIVAAAFSVAPARLPTIALFVITVGKLELPAIQPPIDVSYGVYLYAFPIQQLVSTLDLSFWGSLGLAVFATLVMATLSAVLIERPAMRYRIIRSAAPASP